MTARKPFIGLISQALGRTETPAAPAACPCPHTVHTDVLKGRSRDELARAFIEYSKTIEALEQKRNAAKTKLRELKAAGEEAWDDLKTGAEKAWAEVKIAFHDATSKFK